MLKLPIIPGNVDHFIYIHGARILLKGEALRLLLIQTTKQRSQKETGKMISLFSLFEAQMKNERDKSLDNLVICVDL